MFLSAKLRVQVFVDKALIPNEAYCIKAGVALRGKNANKK